MTRTSGSFTELRPCSARRAARADPLCVTSRRTCKPYFWGRSRRR
jgi:hypothetical protein